MPGDTNGASDVFVRDRLTGHTERVSVSSDGAQGDYSSDSPAISADGRFVAFSSYASNFAADDRAGHRDIFVRDRLQGTTRQLSVSSSSAQGNEDSFSPDISADGRYVSFLSNASNLLPDDGPSPDVFV
ncbi:MAG TPA: calcium-binding protein, partial [Anaerolineae bacterium]|nr:calcium-binding protein [Anaerolineae bacterium]